MVKEKKIDLSLEKDGQYIYSISMICSKNNALGTVIIQNSAGPATHIHHDFQLTNVLRGLDPCLCEGGGRGEGTTDPPHSWNIRTLDNNQFSYLVDSLNPPSIPMQKIPTVFAVFARSRVEGG
jgi:hypothetical protein